MRKMVNQIKVKETERIWKKLAIVLDMSTLEIAQALKVLAAADITLNVENESSTLEFFEFFDKLGLIVKEKKE